MSKRAFVPARLQVPEPKPVRVAPRAPDALPEREPRNLWVMIGLPALVVALIGTIVMLYVSGVRSLGSGMFPMVGMAGLGMLMFSGRFGRARKISWGEQEKNRRSYLRSLDAERDEIQKAVCAQRSAQEMVHSNPQGLGAVIGGPQMWERRRSDPDFLDVRLGVGVQHAPDSVLSVQWPEIPVDEELEPVTGQALRDFILEQRKIRDIAKVVNLRSRPGFSFVGEDLDRVRSLLRSVLSALAVFHNPLDVKLMVVTRHPELWSWMVWLPHNQHDELFDACGWRRLVFTTPAELESTLGADLHMKGKRGAWRPPSAPSPTTMGSALETGGDGHDLGPHWVIVDDNTGSPEAWESVVGRVGKEGITVLRVASRLGTGVGFARDEIFEVLDHPSRHNRTDEPSAAHRRNGRGAEPSPPPMLRAGGKFFAHADQLSVPRAYRYARAMARWTPTASVDVTDSGSGALELLRALGIDDARELNVDRLWAERRSRGDERWAEIPVGAKPNGELQNIVLRAKDFGGFGFHSVVIGTSGSGKSEFFLSLVYGIALTHSPETFNVIFVDMKFESAAQDILGIPHVSAALSNLGKDDRHLAERMRRAIDGEIARRYRLFNSVGARDANDYEEIRLAGRDLEPVPILLVVIDEYLELFANHGKWIDLIIHIGQEGRGANVFFMLGGQRLDLSSLQKVKSNIAFRVALRAESGDDSREVIGSDAAYHLPSKENGFGLLKVGPRDLEPFRCFYLSAPFIVPKRKASTAKTLDMTLTKPRLYTWQYQPLDEADAQALQDMSATDAEPDEFLLHADGFKKKKIVDVLRESLIAADRKAPHLPWLPPLEVSEPVDSLVALYRGKSWDVDYGRNPGLVWPLAIKDIPEDAQQLVHCVDVLRSNVMVVGAKSRGKTTTLMTLMCSAALMYTPARLTFFCVGGATLGYAETLPHVADIVSPADREGVERTVATMAALVSARQDTFRRDKIDINEFRERRFGSGADGLGGTDPNDPYGDVFLVIDDFSDLYAADTVLGDRIIALSGVGPEYGVHLMTSASGWIHGQRQTLLQNSDVRIQLRLQNPGENEMGTASLDARDAAKRTVNRPGFGLTESLHEMLVGMPELAGEDGSRIGTRELGTRVAEVAGVTKHATLKRLPPAVALSEVLAYDVAQRPPAQTAPSIAFMIGEQHDLLPVPLELSEHPGMMILGRALCGKSATLAAVGEAVMARFGPEQAQITIIDPKTGPLRDLQGPGYVNAYAYDQDEIDEVLTTLAQQVLLPRLPAKGLSQEELRALKPWEGPRHFILIDDVQDLRPAQIHPAKPPVGAALWKLMERGRQVGLHVFATRNSSNFGQLEMDPWVKTQRSAKVPTLFMDNDPQNKVSRNVRAQALPAGRGLLVIDDSSVEGVLVGVPSSMIHNFEQQ
ncbi:MULTISPECIES: type VII secretion protein EccCa [Mycolicibacter]|uniref:Type VII secretion protein EccC n=1 Tax=Mycolicibacter sinensis (strain JDM601) TaxID=875328 RepID=A0A1A2XR10_MYCSD|nr:MULTISPECIES: type VII secretion protein EccCa [Mycolicibacter]OBH14767.1 type VII secretion protein EccC [Mycolicibacter sinensis]OBI27603.1 type VII secretion protein EccC [Mycolicibacter sinensis]